MWQGRSTAGMQTLMEAPFETALVGAGRFGQVHAAKLACAAQSRLVAVVDHDQARAEALARRWGASAFKSLGEALERHPSLRACVVATPRAHLAEVAGEALLRSLDVLVEKPGAATSAEFDRLSALASTRGRALRVGYVERFLSDEPQPAASLLSLRAFAAGQTPEELLLDRLCHDLDRAVRVLGPRVSVASVRVRRGVLRIELAGDEGRRGRIVAWPAPSEARRWWTPSGRSSRSRSREPDPLAAQWRAFESIVLGAAPTQGEPANVEGGRSVWRLLDAARAYLAGRAG